MSQGNNFSFLIVVTGRLDRQLHRERKQAMTASCFTGKTRWNNDGRTVQSESPGRVRGSRNHHAVVDPA